MKSASSATGKKTYEYLNENLGRNVKALMFPKELSTVRNFIRPITGALVVPTVIQQL
jgi:hypothetical protein